MALQLIKETAISYTVEVALDAVKSYLQFGVDRFSAVGRKEGTKVVVIKTKLLAHELRDLAL
ncbi:hypothetical protein CKAN_00429300 [Cinnamomum micranthum f. kanehirae]|uniref:Uncharacterized protein n=1 Tax=Cinnamomum micranthum f. kanehirae TaxID=337451 RepID=A0A3S3M9Y5_9MAGN|nr:hypothetical protein CKAN_00429300 [Cinnamomum micranthum f. kanehirae]